MVVCSGPAGTGRRGCGFWGQPPAGIRPSRAGGTRAGGVSPATGGASQGRELAIGSPDTVTVTLGPDILPPGLILSGLIINPRWP